MNGKVRIIDYSEFSVFKKRGQYVIKCHHIKDLEVPEVNTMYLKKHILDKQIVDMDGRKVVRVNDLRLAILKIGTFTVAVDVGLDGLLRRLGVAKPIKIMLKPFGLRIPSQLILWDDVASIDFSHAGIRLSKEYNKLLTLHVSDLADIIEDYDRYTQIAIFNSLDEEKAADVLEELETDAQLNVLESLPLAKAADVLEKMSANDVADILEEMEDQKAENILNEMEKEVSEEVRELMDYSDNTVGSLMTTDYISFNEHMTVNETINILRELKPDSDVVYYLYIVNDVNKLVAFVSLRDIVISEPQTKLSEIMNTNIIYIYDHDKIGALHQLIVKYSLLAVPVVDEKEKLIGMVVINDVVDDIINGKRRRA